MALADKESGFRPDARSLRVIGRGLREVVEFVVRLCAVHVADERVRVQFDRSRVILRGGGQIVGNHEQCGPIRVRLGEFRIDFDRAVEAVEGLFKLAVLREQHAADSEAARLPGRHTRALGKDHDRGVLRSDLPAGLVEFAEAQAGAAFPLLEEVEREVDGDLSELEAAALRFCEEVVLRGQDEALPNSGRWLLRVDEEPDRPTSDPWFIHLLGLRRSLADPLVPLRVRTNPTIRAIVTSKKAHSNNRAYRRVAYSIPNITAIT